MNKIFFLTFVILLLQSCATPNTDQKINQKPEQKAMTTSLSTSPLRHMVLLKFKEDAAPADIQKVENAFRDLPNHIAAIKDFEWGKNNSPEGLNEGFTHCFFVTFENEAGRTVYLPHPKHLAFVEILKPTLDKVLVFDYLAGN